MANNSKLKMMVSVGSVHQPTAMPDFSIRGHGKKSNLKNKSKKKYSFVVRNLGRVMPNREVV